jgi:protein-L-isoaspartate(D-aspartate) O-methyltransferase
MLERLELQSGQRVLEIGTGTGFNSALMKSIVGESGRVVTVDFNEELKKLALDNISKANIHGVEVIDGDGWLGCRDLAPYERIILTASTWDISPAWYEQLCSDGKMVLPLSIKGLQFIVVFNLKGNYLEGFLDTACGFMRMKGSFAEPMSTVDLNYPEKITAQLQIYGQRSVSKKTVSKIKEIFASTRGFKTRFKTEIEVSKDDFIYGLRLWIALNSDNFCILVDTGPWYNYPVGFWNDECVCLLKPDIYSGEKTESKQLEILISGRDYKDKSAGLLIDRIRTWDAFGRPRCTQTKIRAYPKESNSELVLSSEEKVIMAKHTNFILNWS